MTIICVFYGVSKWFKFLSCPIIIRHIHACVPSALSLVSLTFFKSEPARTQLWALALCDNSSLHTNTVHSSAGAVVIKCSDFGYD